MLILVGTNHRSAPVALRERMAFEESRLPESLARLLTQDAIDEGLILSTCNRVEILVRSAAGKHEGLGAVREFLATHHGVSAEELGRHGYHLFGREVIQHLFRVASGLDSMIMGEPQILGQVKQAYRVAKESRSTGPVLERLLQHCLSTAKRVRTDTGISRNPVSVGFAAVKLAASIFGELDGRKALLLGAGKMSVLVAKHLAGNGVGEISVASRTYNNAVRSAEGCGGTAVRWEEGLARLSAVDIVVSCTAAPGQILGKADVARARRGRRGGPLFLIDIAVPRDIDPGVNELDDVYLYDIDALQGVVDSNLDERRRASDQAESLIATEVEEFHRWRQSQDLTPVIVSMRETLLDMARQEVGRFRSKLEPLTDQQQQGVEQLTRALIQKILHRPIRHLRRSVDRGDMAESAALVRELFGVRPPADSEAPPDLSETERSSEDESAALGPHRLLRGGKKD